jgi:hypothetical protein
LVSTYANEGLDFIDEAARFCIIVKCPFPDMGDPQIKTRKERDPAWYDNETLKDLVQMAGRVVRSATDREDRVPQEFEAAVCFLVRNSLAIPDGRVRQGGSQEVLVEEPVAQKLLQLFVAGSLRHHDSDCAWITSKFGFTTLKIS